MLKYQYCIKRMAISDLFLGVSPSLTTFFLGIEITSTKKVKSDTWAQLLVDGEVVHKLASITKGQPLIWDEPLYWWVEAIFLTGLFRNPINDVCSNANSNTVTNFQIYQESYLWLQPILIGSIELSTSEIPIKASTQSIGECLLNRWLTPNLLAPDRTETYRASKTISVSFKFLNSSPLLAAFKTVMTFVTAAIKVNNLAFGDILYSSIHPCSFRPLSRTRLLLCAKSHTR